MAKLHGSVHYMYVNTIECDCGKKSMELDWGTVWQCTSRSCDKIWYLDAAGRLFPMKIVDQDYPFDQITNALLEKE